MQRKVGEMDVFVVENSATMDKGLQSMLSDISDVTIVGHSVDEQDAIEQIDTLLPDVVILDIDLQSGSGFSLLENVKQHHQHIKTVVLTYYSDEHYAARCKSAGADYFFDRAFQLQQMRVVFWKWAHTDRLFNKANGWKTNGE